MLGAQRFHVLHLSFRAFSVSWYPSIYITCWIISAQIIKCWILVLCANSAYIGLDAMGMLCRVTFEKGALRLYSDNLFLDFTGVPDSFAIADFSFLLDGSMRATSRSPEAATVRHNCDFAGSVSLRLSTDLPAAFALIPEGIVTRAGDEILDRIIGAMEGALLQGIIRDYNVWCRMKSRKRVGKPRLPVEPLRTSTN